MASTEMIDTEGIPLTESERRIWSEIEWAEQNEEVQRLYAGEWVALYHHAVVAHGQDRDEVVREATRSTQQPAEELAVWSVMDPATFLEDSPPDDPVFS